MRYYAIWRSRIVADEPAEAKHVRWVNRASVTVESWALDRRAGDDVPDFGRELIVQIPLRRYLPPVVRGNVTYQYRADLADSGTSDDYLELSFSTRRADYATFVTDAFLAYAEAFDAYRAEAGPSELRDLDAEKDDSDFRFDVYRIYPLAYFDADLCHRAFGRSAGEAAEILRPCVFNAEVLNGGLYVVVAPEPMSFDEANQRGLELRRRLS